MLLQVFFAVSAIFCSIFVSANVKEVELNLEIGSRTKHSSASPCTKELAAIVYSPVTQAHVYLAKIASELKVQISAVLNEVSMAQYGLLASFMKKYGVKVTIDTFFGTPFTFFLTDAGIGSGGSDVLHYSQTMGHLGLGFDSFRYEPDVGFYFYGFVVQSSTTATGAIVIIELPATSGPFAPVGCY